MFRRAEHPGRCLREGHDDACYQYRDDGHEQDGLGDVKACGLDLASGKVDGRHYGAARSGHQAQTCEYHPYRHADIDGRDTVAADSVADENTVDGRDRRHAYHPQ